jgi:hypothetical protein
LLYTYMPPNETGVSISRDMCVLRGHIICMGAPLHAPRGLKLLYSTWGIQFHPCIAALRGHIIRMGDPQFHPCIAALRGHIICMGAPQFPAVT